MKFEKWLIKNGYFPLEIMKSNYSLNGMSESKIDERIKELQKEYLASMAVSQ